MDLLSIFRMCMPEEYIKTVIFPETNTNLEGDWLTLSEFYKWLGCRFYQACYVGISPVKLWWSSKEIDKFDGAPFRLNDVMSCGRFKPVPTDFHDKFHYVRQLIDAWNDHMKEAYTPSWLSCMSP
jgi:hypothetical protein